MRETNRHPLLKVRSVNSGQQQGDNYFQVTSSECVRFQTLRNKKCRPTLEPLHSSLIYSARPHENCGVKFTMKKINATILGPHRPAGLPLHCVVCRVRSNATVARPSFAL